MNPQASMVLGVLVLVGAWSLVQQMRFRVRSKPEQTVPFSSGFKGVAFYGILALLTASFLFQVQGIFPDSLVIAATLLLAVIAARLFVHAQSSRSTSGQGQGETVNPASVEIWRVKIAVRVRLVLFLLCVALSFAAAAFFRYPRFWEVRVSFALISLVAMIGSTAFLIQAQMLTTNLRLLQGKAPQGRFFPRTTDRKILFKWMCLILCYGLVSCSLTLFVFGTHRYPHAVIQMLWLVWVGLFGLAVEMAYRTLIKIGIFEKSNSLLGAFKLRVIMIYSVVVGGPRLVVRDPRMDHCVGNPVILKKVAWTSWILILQGLVLSLIAGLMHNFALDLVVVVYILTVYRALGLPVIHGLAQ